MKSLQKSRLIRQGNESHSRYINIPNNSFIQQFLYYAKKYGFPFKMTVFIAIIIMCVAVIALQISRRQPLSQQASLAVGVVLIMAGVGIWTSIRERNYQRTATGSCLTGSRAEKHIRKPKARKS